MHESGDVKVMVSRHAHAESVGRIAFSGHRLTNHCRREEMFLHARRRAFGLCHAAELMPRSVIVPMPSQPHVRVIGPPPCRNLCGSTERSRAICMPMAPSKKAYDEEEIARGTMPYHYMPRLYSTRATCATPSRLRPSQRRPRDIT